MGEKTFNPGRVFIGDGENWGRVESFEAAPETTPQESPQAAVNAPVAAFRVWPEEYTITPAPRNYNAFMRRILHWKARGPLRRRMLRRARRLRRHAQVKRWDGTVYTLHLDHAGRLILYDTPRHNYGRRPGK